MPKIIIVISLNHLRVPKKSRAWITCREMSKLAANHKPGAPTNFSALGMATTYNPPDPAQNPDPDCTRLYIYRILLDQ